MVSLLLLLSLLACDAEDPCVDGSMLDSPEGLTMTAAEHPEGWGRADCWGCHVAAELHRVGCTPDVDLEAIQAIVEDQGQASCADCHGDNGVTP